MDDKPNTTYDMTIKVDSIPPPDVDMYYRFIDVDLLKYFTSTVRSSYEYRTIIAYMKTFMDFESCVYYKGFSMKNGFKIELHHYPFTLFDICEAVANKHMKRNEKIRTMDVCEEVAQLHFKFQVGFVPLNATAHKLYHSGSLEIHPDLIRGFWEEFYEEYQDYLSPEAVDKYKATIEMRHLENPQIPMILRKSPVMLEVKSFVKLADVNLDHLVLSNPANRLKALDSQ